MTRFLVTFFVVLAALAAGAGFEWYAYGSRPVPIERSPARFKVERGAGVAGIARAAQQAGVGVPTWRLWLAARLRGDSRAIKAGTYEVAAPLTLAALLDKLVRGDVVLSELTVVEGWTFRQMRAAVARHPELSHDSAGLSDAQVLERVGAVEAQPEGLFFPSTYRFSPGASDIEVFRQAYRLMKRTLDDAWAARGPDLPLADAYQALVLASVIEKETGRDADRDKIAAVFVNRLRRGMLLQSDPTTIYGLGERFDGNLRKRDLLADGPYNTYARPGLPPTPIALPGKASIAAAVRPAPGDMLYFVARGDGSSEFSADLSAHNRAVARYQLRRAP